MLVSNSATTALQLLSGANAQSPETPSSSKFAVAQLVEKANRKTAWEFLELLLEAAPYKIHTILTDNHCPAGDLRGKSAERGHPVCRTAEKPEYRLF